MSSDLEEVLDYLELLNRSWSWYSVHTNDEGDFKRVQELLKEYDRDYQTCTFS